MVLRLLFLLILIPTLQLYSQEYPEVRVHQLLSSGIDKLINSDYNSAQKEFETLRQEYPSLPLGDIYLASVEITRSYDYQTKYNDSIIISLLDSGKNKAELLLRENDKSLWNKYFMALSEGFSAYYYALNESWISSFSSGLNSVGSFRECLADSVNFYEAFTALGTYLYWRSRKLESLNWLPFLKDETEEGIRMLEIASENAVYSRYLAVNSLIWIYVDLKRFDDAAVAAVKMLNEYPDSRFFRWALARIYEETDKRNSIKVYYEILRSYREPSVVNEITIKHKIAEQYFLLGDNKAALKLCLEILSKNYNTPEEHKNIQPRLKRVEELRSMIVQ